jgi:hypothetical protein
MEMMDITESPDQQQQQKQQPLQQEANRKNEIIIGNEPILLKTLRQRFDFLSEDETATFINSHPWLLEEKDEAIVIDFLKNYYKGLAERHNEIYSRICESEKEGSQENKQRIQGDNANQYMIEEAQVKQEDVYPKEDLLFISFIEKFDNMRAIFDAMGSPQDFQKNVNNIFNILYKIVKYPDNPTARQVNIPKDTNLGVVEILDSLGFIKLELGYDFVYIYSESDLDMFKRVLSLIDTEYAPGLMRDSLAKGAQEQQRNSNQPQMGQPYNPYNQNARPMNQMQYQPSQQVGFSAVHIIKSSLAGFS